MSLSGHDETERFLLKIAEEEFDQAVDELDSDYRQEFAESISTGEDITLPPATALERVFLVLTRQYGSFEEVADITTIPESSNRVEATLQFSTTTQPVQLRFDGDGQIVDLDFQQTYSPPTYTDEEAFAEHEVTIVEDDDLDGTITIPDVDEPVPGVVLVKGSGTTDRDYTSGPNKPYRDIAWGLATDGIAVMRYEERTLTPRDDGKLGLETIVADALTAIDQLRAVDTVRSDWVFVGGWSFGGVPIPRIAQRDGDIAGGIFLDSPSRDVIWENRGDHLRAVLDADWLTDAERDRLEAQAQEFDKIGEEALSSLEPSPIGVELPNA